MCTICSQFYAYQPDCAYREQADSDISQFAGNGATRGGQAALPVFTLDQIAFQLTDAFWTNQGDIRAGFNTSVGGTITVDITALTGAGQQLARWALDAWSAVSGLLFSEVGSSAQITFDDEAGGAYANSSLSGGYLTSSFVNVSKYNWLPSYGTTIDSYSFQTYIHEIGHALGLGHAGHYNGSASYSQTGSGDNHYLNDSWQATVMSYFDQVENTYVTGSYAYTATAMAADILAIQSLYGAAAANPGDTTYGANSTVGGYLGQLFAQLFGEAPADTAIYRGNAVAITLYDTGGTDTLDLSPDGSGQRIDLTPESASDVLGQTGNLMVARGTVIENVITGSGDDTVTGNGADNLWQAGGGGDMFVIALNSSDVTIIQIEGGYQLVSAHGTDTLIGAEYVQFSDQELDLSTLENEPPSPDPNPAPDPEPVPEPEPVPDPSPTPEPEPVPDPTPTPDPTPVPEPTPDPDPDPPGSIDGSAGNDVLAGTGQADLIRGFGGNDTLVGNNGADTLSGNQGNDRLSGNQGNDRLNGGYGNDTLFGNKQADVLFGNQGNDTLFGGEDNDTLHGGMHDDLMKGGLGNDRLIGNQGNDTLNGGYGNDTLFGNKQADVLFGNQGNDTLFGGEDNDTLHGGMHDDLMKGGLGNDRLIGNQGNDTLNGGYGNDTLFGNKQADVLFGNQGNDTLFGGEDNDTLHGGMHDDLMKGGLGADHFVFIAGLDRIADFQVGIDTIALANGLWPGTLTPQQVVDTFASVSAGSAVFDFGGGNRLIIDGFGGDAITDTTSLIDDIFIL